MPSAPFWEIGESILAAAFFDQTTIGTIALKQIVRLRSSGIISRNNTLIDVLQKLAKVSRYYDVLGSRLLTCPPANGNAHGPKVPYSGLFCTAARG